jgi:hypothetical protein
VDGLVTAIHRDVVDVNVDEQVALGDTAADADLLSPLRLPDDDVSVRILRVVVIEPLRIEARHDPVAQAMPKLGLRHPAVEAQSRDEVDVLNAPRVRLLQYLLDDLLPDIRPPHRRQGKGEVVKGDGQLHAGGEQLMQRLHVKRFEQRSLDGDVRIGQRIYGAGRVDHTRPLRQLLVVETVPRVEHHRRAVSFEGYRETGSAQ